MAAIRVEIDYHLDADVWLRNDCMAESFGITRGNVEVRLRLPPFSDSSPLPNTMDELAFDGYAGRAEGHISQPSQFWLAINKLRVIVRNDVEGISQAALLGVRAAVTPDLISQHEQQCRGIADRLVIDFLDRLRCSGQTWLGPIGTLTHSVMPRSTTYEEETNYRFRYGYGGTIRPAPRSIDKALDPISFENLKKSLADPKTVPLADAFLADADFFLGRGIHEETQNDLQRAVLLTAIACEIKVKETLRSKVFPGGLPLVEALISNPRDFSMSAAGLFDKAMKAAVGCSLKESDSVLYKLITTLFERRNKVAHIGMAVEADGTKEIIVGARRVFDWLDNLPVGKSPSAD